MWARRALPQILIAAAVVTTFILGTVGFSRWDSSMSLPDAGYLSLQLFGLEFSPLDGHGPTPQLISVLRFVAPLCVATSLLVVFGRATRDRFDHLRAHLARDHVVVTGSPTMRHAVIDDRRRLTQPGAGGRRQTVVAIVDPSQADERGSARQRGAIVVVCDPKARIATRTVARAEEVIVAYDTDGETLRWAEQFARSARCTTKALVQHADMAALGKAAGLTALSIQSVAFRAAASALSIEGAPQSAQGPVRAVVVTDGHDAAELVLAIDKGRAADEHAQIHAIGPVAEGLRQRCAGVATVSFEVHTCELDQISRQVRTLAGDDPRWTLANPIYVWMSTHAISLATARAVCEALPDNRVCVITTDDDVLMPPPSIVGVEACDVDFGKTLPPLKRPQLSFLGVTEMSEYGVFLPSEPRTTLLAAYVYMDHCRYALLESICGPHALGRLELRRWASLDRRAQEPYVDLAAIMSSAFGDLGIVGTVHTSTESWNATPPVLLEPDELWHVAQRVALVRGRSAWQRSRSSAGDLRERQPFIDFAGRSPYLFELAGIQLARAGAPGVIGPASIEPMAQAFNDAYLRTYPQQGSSWAALDEPRKESNRELARNVASTIAALGGTITQRPSSPDWELGEAEREVLSELEHQRWCRAHFDRGFQPGSPRDFRRRIHPDLKPYSLLSHEDKEKDRLMIDTMPAALAAAGLGLELPA